MLSVRLTPQAERDLEEIWLFSAQTWSLQQAETYVAALADTFELLRITPEMAPERREISPPVRIHRHRSHLIVYRIETEVLLVIRVLHMKAHWRAALDHNEG